jgi:hypothetical protein
MSVFDHVFAGGALVCGVATWIVPPLLFAAPWKEKPRSSLAAVGRTIGTLVIAAILSAAGVLLALLAFAFAQTTDLARYGLLAIAAFWVLLVTGSYVGSRRSRGRPNGTEGR